MSVLEHLIETDRVVIAGLSAYDKATARILDETCATMAQNGRSAEEIDLLIGESKARIAASRIELHRALWKKALAIIAESAAPGGGES